MRPRSLDKLPGWDGPQHWQGPHGTVTIVHITEGQTAILRYGREYATGHYHGACKVAELADRIAKDEADAAELRLELAHRHRTVYAEERQHIARQQRVREAMQGYRNFDLPVDKSIADRRAHKLLMVQWGDKHMHPDHEQWWPACLTIHRMIQSGWEVGSSFLTSPNGSVQMSKTQADFADWALQRHIAASEPQEEEADPDILRLFGLGGPS